MGLIQSLSQQAAKAAKVLALLTTEQKNQVLQAMAHALRAETDQILVANQTDLTHAKKK